MIAAVSGGPIGLGRAVSGAWYDTRTNEAGCAYGKDGKGDGSDGE